MTNAHLGLLLAAWTVLGCERSAPPPRSTEAVDKPDTAAPLDICAGLDPEACGVKGTQLSDDPRTELDSVPMLKTACARHDGRSCSNLGTEFSSSMNPKIRNPKKAVASYSDGCNLGYLTACCHAAELIEADTGVDKNVALAAQLYKRGCDSDEGIFICCLGLARLYGKGGPGLVKDRTLRNAYYRRAKLLGYSDHLEDD